MYMSGTYSILYLPTYLEVDTVPIPSKQKKIELGICIGTYCRYQPIWRAASRIAVAEGEGLGGIPYTHNYIQYTYNPGDPGVHTASDSAI